MDRPVVVPHLFSVRSLFAGFSASPDAFPEFHPTIKRKKYLKMICLLIELIAFRQRKELQCVVAGIGSIILKLAKP